PGLRVQTRYRFDASDDNHDIYIARVRLKGGGNAFGIATYYTEVKLDGTGRFGGSTSAAIENAWLNFEVNPEFAVRVGFGDIPFSRDALTSDSKLLLVDRSRIKDGLTSVGMADNTIGVMLHGRPSEGRFEFAGGVFDNLAFERSGDGPEADRPMVAGRFALNLLDPSSAGGYGDYRGSYVGSGRRLAIGASAAYLSAAHDGATELNVSGVGADLYFNNELLSFQAEVGRYARDYGDTDEVGKGGFVQGGILASPQFELTARFQQFDPNDDDANDRERWTSVGANYYIRDHNLKVQADFTIRKEQGTEIDNNFFQIQLQLDF
ncbi:MAG: porin, partial [Gemmatimonadota bacterium]